MTSSEYAKTVIGVLVGVVVAFTAIAGGFYTLFRIVGYIHNGS